MKEKKSKKPRNKYLKFSGAGLQMGLTIYFGNLLGKWLDQKYTQQVSLESIITLLAVFIAMYTLIKLAINISK